jgi:hypothetical protein
MLVDRPESRMAIVLTWPDDSITWELSKWLQRHFLPDKQIRVCQRGPIDSVRCGVVFDYCLNAPPEVSEFIFIDRDMRPDERTDPILEAEGDVVGCEYPLSQPQAADAIHLGLVKVKRTVLEVMAAEHDKDGRPIPIFAFSRSADNARITGCECRWFVKRAVGLGFEVRRAGFSHHDLRDTHRDVHPRGTTRDTE